MEGLPTVQLSTIMPVHSQRQNEFAGGSEGSGGGVGIGREKSKRGINLGINVEEVEDP